MSTMDWIIESKRTAPECITYQQKYEFKNNPVEGIVGGKS